ncbi:MAG: hypothetical protein ABI691_20370, partial [Ginsengibacter sp.]
GKIRADQVVANMLNTNPQLCLVAFMMHKRIFCLAFVGCSPSFEKPNPATRESHWFPTNGETIVTNPT